MNSTYFSQKKRVLSKKTQDKLVLFLPGSDTFLELNEVSTFLWEQLRFPTPKIALVNKLKKAYQADPDILRADLDNFLDGMIELGVVVMSKS